MSNINLRYIKKFFVISGSITGIYLVLAAAVTLTIIASESNLIRNLRPQQNQSSEGGQIEGETSGDNGGDQIAKQETEDDESFLKPPPRTNFLIIALDQERVLTDALMVGCFYRDTQEIHLMSIPRDLYTQLPDHRLKEMQNEGRHPPSYMKINALRSYGGRLNGIRYLSEQLGEMLGVKFSYYVEVSLPAFKKTVDAIGGVWMEIPNVTGDGIYYYDEFQDLLIDLKAGMQELDGNKAEQLVRFRSYPSGDVGRNAVQMEFMKQLFRQALKREAIMNDPLALYNAIRSEVETDMGVEILSYIPYFSRFTGDKIFTHSMPGVGDYGDDGLSYFFPDGKAMPGVIQQVFYANMQSNPTQSGGVSEDSIEKNSALKVQVLNGSRVAGLASSFADTLASDGYNVVDVDAYTGAQERTTRIQVNAASDGTSFLKYFKHAEIETASLPGGVDVVIIVGQDEG